MKETATVINIKNEKNHSLTSDVLSVRNKELNQCIEKIKRFIPEEIYGKFLRCSSFALRSDEHVEEIRLRCGMNTYATIGGREKRNVELPFSMTHEEMSATVRKMCDGSLYAYGESIIKGYISLGDGIRVGVCGKASVENGKILGVYNISALNIRFPRFDIKADGVIIEKIRKTVMRGDGVLIYSPPAQGKTTFLRAIAVELSKGENALRTVIVDTREELGSAFSQDGISADIMSGYPQPEGIRIATAFMNPQAIICDEIGSDEDALAIAQAQNCGVPLVATAHGANISGILKRRGILYLHEICAFGLYVGISMDKKGGFLYRVHRREEVENAIMGNSGDSARRNGSGIFSDS